MRIETHIHTRYSKDSMQPLWGIYFMCRLHHIDVVAITDHNTIAGGVEFKKKFEKNSPDKFPFIRGIQVIIGSEIMTDCGEIIGLFLNKEISSGLSPDVTISKIREQNGLVYLPHPYDEKRSKTVLSEAALQRLHSQIDCVECHNGRNIEKLFSIRQNIIGDLYGFVKVIGSDAHTMIEVGRNYMFVENAVEITEKECFLSVIKNAQLHRKKCIMFCHHITKIEKIIKLLRKGNFYEVYRTVIKQFRK